MNGGCLFREMTGCCSRMPPVSVRPFCQNTFVGSRISCCSSRRFRSQAHSDIAQQVLLPPQIRTQRSINATSWACGRPTDRHRLQEPFANAKAILSQLCTRIGVYGVSALASMPTVAIGLQPALCEQCHGCCERPGSPLSILPPPGASLQWPPATSVPIQSPPPRLVS